MRPRTSFYPGWMVIVALFLAGMMVYGAGLYGFTLMVPPLSAEFGWSRAATGGLVSVFWLAAPLTPLGGAAVARFGAAKLVCAGILLEAVCLAAVGIADSLTVMYVLRALMGLGKIMMMAGVTAQASVWFGRRFGLAIAVCYAGWHFGGLTLAPLAQYLIDSAGWRHACLILAGLIVIVALPPMLLFGSRRPAGALPPEEAIPTSEAFGPDVASPSAFRSGAFWLVVAMTVLCSFTYGGLLTHEVALIEDAGISPAMAAIGLSVTAAMALAGALTVGHLSDRVGFRPVLALEIGLFATAVGLLFWLPANGSTALMLVAAAAFGLAIGGFDTCIVAHLRRAFGRSQFNHLFGIWYFFYLATLFLAPIAAGRMFDRSGDYRTALLAMLGGLFVAAFLLMFAGRPERAESPSTTAG